MSVLFTYLSSAGEAWRICPTLDWDNPFHDTVICSFAEDGGSIWKSSKAGWGWSAGNVDMCSFLNHLSNYFKTLSKFILSMYYIWHNKMKHLNIVLLTHPTVRECLAQFEDLKVKLQSECHVKEKEVSLYFEWSFNAYCNTHLSLCSCCD